MIAKSNICHPFSLSEGEDDLSKDDESTVSLLCSISPIDLILQELPESLDDEVVLGAQLWLIASVVDQVRLCLPEAEGAVWKLGVNTAKAIDRVNAKVMSLYGLMGKPDKELVKSAP